MKNLAFATLMAVGVSAVAIAQQLSEQTDQVSFDTADKNGDGRVNRYEAGIIAGFDFARADTNADLALTRQEFHAALATSTPRGDGVPGARSDHTAHATFDTADKNKDGKITRAEAHDIKGFDFRSADADDDASLSRQEFQSAMASSQPGG